MKPLAGFSAAILRQFGRFVASGGPGGSLLVLSYHRVLPEWDPLLPDEPDAARFAAQLDVLQELCSVLPLCEAIERLHCGSLPARAACITFDDGYANTREVAAPLLARRSLSATVFVAAGFLNGRMWNDTIIESVRHAGAELNLDELGLGRYRLADVEARRAAIESILNALKYKESDERLAISLRVAERSGTGLPRSLMLSERQVRELPALGVQIGAHTVSHPILARLTPADARREITSSKAMLEELSGVAVESFAYPNGRPHRDYSRLHVEMVQAAGFKTAVTTAWGAASRHSDRFQVPRMLPWEDSALRFGARLISTYRERSIAQV